MGYNFRRQTISELRFAPCQHEVFVRVKPFVWKYGRFSLDQNTRFNFGKFPGIPKFSNFRGISFWNFWLNDSYIGIVRLHWIDQHQYAPPILCWDGMGKVTKKTSCWQKRKVTQEFWRARIVVTTPNFFFITPRIAPWKVSFTSQHQRCGVQPRTYQAHKIAAMIKKSGFLSERRRCEVKCLSCPCIASFKVSTDLGKRTQFSQLTLARNPVMSRTNHRVELKEKYPRK